MKLSDKTIALLKNFSGINQSILIKKGNKLRTISVMKNILAEATINENFTSDFGIYDLNQFLNTISIYNNPDLDFGNSGYLLIKEGRSSSKHFFADPNVIVSPPEKEINLPSEDVCFELTTEQLDKVLKSVQLIRFPTFLLLVLMELLNLSHETRKMKHPTLTKRLLVKLILILFLTLKLKILRFFGGHMK